jgi:hypothetical protein
MMTFKDKRRLRKPRKTNTAMPIPQTDKQQNEPQALLQAQVTSGAAGFSPFENKNKWMIFELSW